MNKFTKIVCQIDSLENMFQLQREATAIGIPNVMIEDEGDTVFNGVPTITCLGIGPEKSETIDLVTKDLQLL